MDGIAEDMASPRRFVASLVSALSAPPDGVQHSANPLSHAASKDLFLTLHVLFQNELLPALDLLDRGLVTRLRLTQPDESSARTTNAPQQATGEMDRLQHREGLLEQHAKMPCTYYVRSAQQQSSRSTSRFRHAAYEHTTYYEVRLHAWSCSCPAFAFSAFPATALDCGNTQLESAQDFGDSPAWRFGGLTLGSGMPVCKHLLACALVEHSSMFVHMVDERKVSVEEMAGWAAGWGD